ncbi:DNA/RNA non-specific endonuclease [Okeania sp.]|uniref:DNA/RNA non-specific endonuclease n=1 Tax=Okeania sp. TaxID=3100323 RepID=UPI002B4AED0F|nr:DNA/RNA non-specific endonuclease [Okeania sp.]MEB3340026.1 DNA/RNA non-specific endonuclease [Okeania sp.]
MSEPWNVSFYGQEDDFNPNRILTATWQRDPDDGIGKWTYDGGKTWIEGANTSFTIPENRTLTAGQTYYWAVETFSENELHPELEFGELTTEIPPALNGDDTFHSVSLLTHGFQFPGTVSGVPERYYDLADGIANLDSDTDGLILRYEPATGYWVPVNEQGQVLFSPSGNNYLAELREFIAPENPAPGQINYLESQTPVVLLADWSHDSSIPDSGFSEAAADSLFASLVQLDQLLMDENSDTTQGPILSSPLHLIGFSRGTVVNSEIVQRLGTYFPEAGGKPGTGQGDLQMTTLDPHDFDQPGLSLLGINSFTDFREPKVQVWDHVTFADNYYQTVPNLLANSLTPAGRDIPNLPATESGKTATGLEFPRQGWRSESPNPNAPLLGEPDLSVFLGTNKNEPDYNRSRAGFTRETDPFYGLGGTHTRVPSWYAGTVDLESVNFPNNEQSDEHGIYRQRSDGRYEQFFDSSFSYGEGVTNKPRVTPWYRPDHKQAGFNDSAEDAPSEGIGTGWFYSVLGGGKDLRTQTGVDKVPVDFDNTYDAQMRGDFAVPTLFNGNFDAVFNPKGTFRKSVSQAIPGWSFHGGGSAIMTKQLVDLKGVSTLTEHLKNVGNDPTSKEYQTDYALQLRPGDSITHNRFVVPDEGVLRFDLHVPNAASNPRLPTSSIRTFIRASDSTNWQPLTPTFTYKAQNPAERGENAVGYYDFVNGQYIDPYTRQIDYGQEGFETFHIEIPDELRGKSAQLRFDLGSSSSPVYLDNVFFKSQHLMLGNPSFAKPSENTHRENYLIEKPQYSLSYNDAIKGPNWVSWQLNQSWLGGLNRIDIEPRTPPEGYNDLFPPGFDDNFPDYPDGVRPVDGTFSPVSRNSFPWSLDDELPENWVKTQGVDYLMNNQITPRRLDRGHMVPVSYRTRSFKDGFSTYLTTNMLPQLSFVNRTAGPWFRLERETRLAVEGNSDLEFNIIAGGVGYDPTRQGPRGDDIRYPAGHPFENHPNPVPGVVQNFVATQQNEETGEWEYVQDSNDRIVINLRGSNEWIANPKQIGVPDYTWKVFVPLHPGQGAADITQNTPVTAVIFPNADPRGFPTVTIEDTEFYRIPLPNGTELTIDSNSVGDWTQYAISVRELEDITGYDFFSEVPRDIQNIIEPRTNRELFLA